MAIGQSLYLRNTYNDDANKDDDDDNDNDDDDDEINELIDAAIYEHDNK